MAMSWRYKVRKAYVIINPFFGRRDMSHRVQWIMRDAPLFSYGVPFFFEPWVNSDDFSRWVEDGKVPPLPVVCKKFLIEFLSYLKRRITGVYISDDGTVWRWNPGTRTYQQDG